MMAGKPWTEERKKEWSIRTKGSGNNFFQKKHTQDTKDKITRLAKKRTIKSASRCVLTDRQYEVLDGAMLADCCIEPSSISGRISYGCKFIETIESLQNEFTNLIFSPIWQSKITNCYHGKSRYYRDLRFEYERWYGTGKNNLLKTLGLLRCRVFGGSLEMVM